VRVFVIGSRGLVGSELVPALRARGHEVAETDLPEGDVTRPESLRAVLGAARPDWVVNLAARTAVDDAEADPEGTFAANAEGAGNAARLAASAGARLLQVSTDYVFDGRKGAPYREDDERRPLSVYGKSKAAGEDRVRAALAGDRLLLVRAQTLFGRGGKSFPDAILRLASSRTEIPVVTDQVVQPTWARDLAAWMAALLDRNATGTFHLASADRCTWNEFARAVLEEWGIAGVRIVPTTAAAFGRPAPRPAYSVFDTGRFEEATGIRPRPWREALRAYRRASEVAA
jgi:dTDP-4-dehydrorhamnose reductase